MGIHSGSVIRDSVTDPESFPAASARKQANSLSSKPFHAIAGRTLRHWTIDRRQIVGRFLQPALALPFAEQPGGSQFHLLALKLARVRSELAHRVS